ncbi:MAG: hypothetical protein HDR43_01160 [Mycoplasma sp.]|nr:hypothetical protein [Mycoplasma sp.]
MKKTKKKKILFTAIPVTLATPLIIFSCNSNSNNNVTINEELTRINSLNLKLKNNSLISIDQLDALKNDQSNFLETTVDNINLNNKFIYNVVNFSYSNNQFKFNIAIREKDLENIKIYESKEFVLKYEILEEVEIQKEIEQLNKNNSIKLHTDTFEQSDLDKINANNFIEYISFSKNNNYKYDVISFNKDTTNKQFIFQLKLTNINHETVAASTNNISLNFQIKNNTTTPSTPSNDVQSEVQRLNNELNPRLINPDLTLSELQNINIDNLFSKLIGLNFDDKNFQYKCNFIFKDTAAGSNKISFNIRVYKEGEPVDNNKNFTKNFDLKFNFINNKEEEKVEDNYLKNNIADPYTGGAYDLARPGGGTGKNSVILTNGPAKTTPSDGVPEYAKSIKGKIYNETEMKQLKNTFSLGFVDYSGGAALGTGWILDYKLTDDDSYPTTWYFATNSHVIQNLKVPNDTISPERYELEDSEFYNTKWLILKRVKTEILQLGQEVANNNYNLWQEIRIPSQNLKTIFIGNDYLTTTPSSFTNDGKWQNSEEYIDFAVIEVTFESSQDAKTFTQDYVNDTSRHFKYREKSILQDYNLKKENGYSIVGFPDAKTGHTYYRNVDLYTNRAADDNNNPIVANNLFSNLATSNYYNTFNNRKGMFDAALGLSFFGYDYRQAYQLRTWYNSWGLTYGIDYSNLGEGSSGSMLMDSDGYTVGIYFAADPRAAVGLAQALYCEGFSYQNKFGSYNLEGYDLIKGGFPNQKISYKDNLKKLYGNNYKTKLFPNGI